MNAIEDLRLHKVNVEVALYFIADSVSLGGGYGKSCPILRKLAEGDESTNFLRGNIAAVTGLALLMSKYYQDSISFLGSLEELVYASPKTVGLYAKAVAADHEKLT